MAKTPCFILLCALLAQGIPAAAGQNADPAKPGLALDGDSAVITILIKPDKASDFEAVLGRLKAALQKSHKPLRQAQAAGWQVFKSLEAVQGNAVYVMRIDPVVRGADYDVTRILAEELPDEVRGLHQKYLDAFAGRSITVTNRLPIQGLGGANSASNPVAGTARDRGPQPPLLRSLNADAAIITVLVRPEKTMDLESTLGFLGRSLQKSDRPVRREQAAGWKVFKSVQPINGNAAYVMSIDPVMQEQEYDVIRLIGEAYPAEVQEIFQKYRDAFVGQAIVRLTRLMTLAP